MGLTYGYGYVIIEVELSNVGLVGDSPDPLSNQCAY